MPVIVDRETLSLDLRTYGEDALAQRVAGLTDEELDRIHERADDYLYGEANGLIAKAVTLAAIEILEGAARQPRWKRRKIKGIHPEEPKQPPSSSAEPVERREVEQAIAAALTEAGYRQASSREHIFSKPLADGVNGWASYFVERLKTGEMEVMPTVGVRHERIHELIDRLQGRRGSSTEPTATIILGYLLPENTANIVWRFDQKTPIDEVARGVAEYIVSYGEPWMREHASEERIIEDARADRKLIPERLPVALLLAGRPGDARAALDAELDEIGDRTDAAAEDFRQFAERFRNEALTPASNS